MKAQKNFYGKLFSYSETDFDIAEGECIKYLDNVNIPHLSNNAKKGCEGEISMKELEESVQALQNNKTPGPDGLPGEFYKVFWADISNLLLNVLNDGHLSKSQKQGVLCLIPKKRKGSNEIGILATLIDLKHRL